MGIKGLSENYDLSNYIKKMPLSIILALRVDLLCTVGDES